MEEPTEEHVKQLLMKWVSVNNIVRDASNELARRERHHTTHQLLRIIDAVSDITGARHLSPVIFDAWTQIMETRGTI